ncbi:CapA family protein [Paenibacillus solisilvae]|uniref:CapA family protein n=1 Tax=Paenibacillus solisilvae TaxID=2486751 RepID=A0ABW0VUQ3_9BACL
MTTEITIAAVGDILMKPLMTATMRKAGTNDYDFGDVFEPVASYLRDADLTIGNLETTFAGLKSTLKPGDSGEHVYTKSRRNPKTRNPVFNSPDEFAKTLQQHGFDVLTTANNHCMDYGIKGLNRTLRVLDTQGIAHTGTNRNLKESRKLLVRDVKGIKVGVLAYTRDTNSIPVPKDRAWAVNRISPSKIKADIDRLKAKADIIIVCLHFGYEYHKKPSVSQKKLVRLLFKYGSDVVLGSHPHVIQPAVFVRTKDQSGISKKRFAIYSLGNFVCTRLHGNDHTLNGVIVRLKVRKTKSGSLLLANAEYIPTWVSRTGTGDQMKYQIVPLKQALSYPKVAAVENKRMKRIHRHFLSHIRRKY